MNPFPNIDFPFAAPIPHQFAMKVYVDTWICITEKFGNMGFIEAYEGILRYGKFRYPTIPNFIMLSISLKSLDFQGLPESDAFGLRHFRMDLYARKPCLIQIAAQPDPRIQM